MKHSFVIFHIKNIFAITSSLKTTLKITYINKSPSTIDSTEKTAFIKVFKTLLKQFKQTFEHLIHLHENKKMNFIIILMKK
jgi:hypothetical protein